MEPVDTSMLRETHGFGELLWGMLSSQPISQTTFRSSTKKDKLPYSVYSQGARLGGPWDITLGQHGGKGVELVFWTAAGDGLHFDLVLPFGAETDDTVST